MSDRYAERIAREGPLPGVDDDSELVGDDEKNGRRSKTDGDVEVAPVALPVMGAGAYPVPPLLPEDLEDENAPADQEAER